MVSGSASRIAFLTDGGVRFGHGASGTGGNAITEVYSLSLTADGKAGIGMANTFSYVRYRRKW